MGSIDETNLTRQYDDSRYRFDYKGMHRYIITIPVYAAKKVFVKIETVRPVLDIIGDNCRLHNFDLYAYCFLPNKLALLVRGKKDNSDMRKFLGEFRQASTAKMVDALGHPLWKRKYTERVLRKTEDSRRVADEMFLLPVQAGLVEKWEDYPFLGSFVLNFREKKPHRDRR